MADYTEVLNTDYSFDNINIFSVTSNRTKEVISFRARPKDGYVMIDNNAKDTETDFETGVVVPVIYYKTVIVIPTTYDFNKFHWVAVHEDSTEIKA